MESPKKVKRVGLTTLVVCDAGSSGEYVGNYVLYKGRKMWMDLVRWNMELEI